ncbi:MAG: PIN domain-containing protein [Lachnospiraceae bacterium]|nr:PIN domain-containing protein [Lachnospiraceae bacterium]
MRLLPDSNIFIDYWKNKSEDLGYIFESEDVVVCGVVRAELLHGAISEKHLRSMTAMLDAFDEEDLGISGWQMLGENLYKLRTHGISVSFTDAVIATIAITKGIVVWTRDNHFKLIQSVLEGLEVKFS